MANPRTRKRVTGIRRAPDGSAFYTCDGCGALLVLALSNMHQCESNKETVKRFKGTCGKHNVRDLSSSTQPRSPFRHFMEIYAKICKDGDLLDIDRQGFDIWKKMSKEERRLYVLEAEAVNLKHENALLLEEHVCIIKVDQEADSASVGKYDLRALIKQGTDAEDMD